MFWLKFSLTIIVFAVILVLFFRTHNVKPYYRWACGLIVMVFTLLLYFMMGYNQQAVQLVNDSSELKPIIYEAIAEGQGIPDRIRSNDLPKFIHVLQKILQTNQDKAHGWFLLGAAYAQLHNLDAAQLAFKKALSLKPDHIDYVMAYAKTHILTNNNQLTPETYQLLSYVIQKQPNHQGALGMLGMGAFTIGDYQLAMVSWQRLLAVRGEDSRGADLLKTSIAKAKQLYAQTLQETKSDEATGALSVTVRLAHQFREAFNSNAMLFVIAKEAQGSPIPIAVKKLSAATLPVSITLSDQDAMMPNRKLSDFTDIKVIARVSQSGQAQQQPGDLEGEFLVNRTEASDIAVLIDKRL